MEVRSKASIIEQMAAKSASPWDAFKSFLDFWLLGSGRPCALSVVLLEFGLRPDIVDGQPILRNANPRRWSRLSTNGMRLLSKADDNGIEFANWRDHYEPDSPEFRLGYKLAIPSLQSFREHRSRASAS